MVSLVSCVSWQELDTRNREAIFCKKKKKYLDASDHKNLQKSETKNINN